MPPGCATAKALRSIRAGRLFVTQHGRDQLSQNWPKLFTSEQSAQLPAEEIVELKQGADYGWPECYYDGLQNKLVLAPEYGGDGGKKAGVCAEKTAPVAALPGHWAPNDLLIYAGKAFPAAYRGGASSPFTAPGIGHPSRRAVITSCFSRSRTARHPATSSSSLMDLPAP